MYQGVWADDVAKCGEYVNNPDKVGRALPMNGLEDPGKARSDLVHGPPLTFRLTSSSASWFLLKHLVLLRLVSPR